MGRGPGTGARVATELLASLGPIWPESLLPAIREERRDRTLVVLDDDPTGTQTVRDVEVLIDPSTVALTRALAARPAIIFVLTNSRSLPTERAAALAGRLGRRIRVASRRSGRLVSLVSRSDSTLRGHFPAEVDALAVGAGIDDAPVLLMPYLGEAGRITVDDIHYVVRGGTAMPVAETEFARDPAFGYGESNLHDWVTARLSGVVGTSSRPILSLSIETIRRRGPDAVAAAVRAAPARSVVIANAADDRDAEVVAAGIVDAERDRAVIARTAAGYVSAAAAQERQPLLGPSDLRHGSGPGLVIVGSHVPTTTHQLDALL